jgi:integrase
MSFQCQKKGRLSPEKYFKEEVIMKSTKEKIFGIGEAARKCGCTVKQIRHWEERNYIPPAQRGVINGKSSYVFLNRYGRTLKPCPLRKHAWTDVLKKVGLEYRTLMHTRHTYITMMLDSGEHIGWVARQVGHTSPR